MKPQKFFYTAEPIRKKVSKQEFLDFIKNYPRKLTIDCCGISEPPTITYNDFELANRWPYSIMASTDNSDYFIIINYEELFKSKTGNVAE